MFSPRLIGLVVSAPNATEESGAKGREIESEQGMYKVVGYFSYFPPCLFVTLDINLIVELLVNISL
jgi:hypothetical protein